MNRPRMTGHTNVMEIREIPFRFLPPEPLPGGMSSFIYKVPSSQSKKHRPAWVVGDLLLLRSGRETLEEALLSLSSREELGFPHPVQQVHILDDTPPFTRGNLSIGLLWLLGTCYIRCDVSSSLLRTSYSKTIRLQVIFFWLLALTDRIHNRHGTAGN
jgi:hypothetical protein